MQNTRFLPAIWVAYREGRLSGSQVWTNLLSGTVVAVVAIPLALGFAIASGAKPEQGLYTAIVAALCVSLFGGTRLQIAGPTGAFVAVLSSVTALYGIDGLQVATVMAGVILFLLGLLRAGDVIRYIPQPVIVGFTCGIAVIIWVGQWRYFFGLHPTPTLRFWDQLLQLVLIIHRADVPTTILSAIGLVVALLAPKIAALKRVPAPLVVLVVLTALAQTVPLFGSVDTLGSVFGELPHHLPVPRWPDMSVARVIQLIGPAITIALLGAIESLLSAVIADGMSGSRHQPDQELMGQGIANIVAPVFGGFAATGAIARTATNVRAGASSPLSGVFHSVILLLLMWFLAPYAKYIPLSALAAVLFMVAFNMAHLDEVIRTIRRAPRADGAIVLVTIGLTVFTDIVVAVNVGVLLAALHFMRRMAHSVQWVADQSVTLNDALYANELSALPQDVLVFSVQGPIFFAAAPQMLAALKQTHTEPRWVLLRIDQVPFVDWSGITALEDILEEFERRSVNVGLIGANPRVAGKLTRAQFQVRFKDVQFFDDVKTAIRFVQSSKPI